MPPKSIKAVADDTQAFNETFGPEEETALSQHSTGNGITLTGDILKQFAGMGMKRVDPMDIRPPQIVLVQKSSDFDMLIDKNGVQAKLGQFFHTGKREIYPDFEAHFLFAAKGTYTNKRKPEAGPQPQYSTIGMMANDMSLFGMMFRSSALWSLSPLFSSAGSQQIPMFAYQCKIETKKLSNDMGEWWIPVVRVGEVEADNDRLEALFQMAKRYDEKTDVVAATAHEDVE